ncbi:MAG TPA: hypothetical protein VH253_17320 [Phycisphaerae bacterium]|nr:hypothetical protein [Phycisphaerae bacterium]
MATKFIRYGKDVDPAHWDDGFKKKIVDAGDQHLFSMAIVKKCWALGMKELCEAGTTMELTIDVKEFTWVLSPKTPAAKELAKKTKADIINRKGRSSGKAEVVAPDPSDSKAAKVEKTLKYLDAGGNIKDFVTFIIAVPAVGMNPLGLLAAGWKTLDTAVGMGIGLANHRNAWGAEISKSALTRLADYATEKLQERRMEALKAAANDDLKARALYVAALQKEVLKLKTARAEWVQRETELTNETQQLSAAAFKWHKHLETTTSDLIKCFKSGLTPDQFNKIVTGMEKIIASHKELSGFHQKYVMDTASDLWKRGAPLINQSAVTINALEKEIEAAKTTDWFAKQLQNSGEGKKSATSGSEGTMDPAQAKEFADLMLALSDDINLWDVGGTIQLALNTVAGLYNFKETINAFRTPTNKWRSERKSVWQTLETGWNNWTLSKMPTTPKEKEKWKQAAAIELEKMESAANELRQKQSAMEDVVLKHNENLQKAYGKAVADMNAAKKAYEEGIQKTKRTLDKAQGTLKNPRFSDKQRRKELQSIVGQIQNKRNELKKRLDERVAELGKVEELAAQENKYCMDILNEGHAQDINKRAAEIEKLQKQLATV